jgi:hypothetical protein
MLAASGTATLMDKAQSAGQKALMPAVERQQSLEKSAVSRADLSAQALPLFESNEKEAQANKKNIKHADCIGQFANASALVSLFLVAAFPFDPIGHSQLQPRKKYELRSKVKCTKSGMQPQGSRLTRWGRGTLPKQTRGNSYRWNRCRRAPSVPIRTFRMRWNEAYRVCAECRRKTLVLRLWQPYASL